VPFVAAYALETLRVYRGYLDNRRIVDAASPGISEHNPFIPILRNLVGTSCITTIIVVFGFFFVFSTYSQYPLYSSGYWGWQAGPRDSIGYFLDHQDEYDEFYLQGQFNGPAPFLPFYIHDPELLKRAHIGDEKLYQPGKRQLFVVEPGKYANDINLDEWNLVTTITYPDNSPAFYLISHK
jgi:hypothetical protein